VSATVNSSTRTLLFVDKHRSAIFSTTHQMSMFVQYYVPREIHWAGGSHPTAGCTASAASVTMPQETLRRWRAFQKRSARVAPIYMRGYLPTPQLILEANQSTSMLMDDNGSKVSKKLGDQL